MGAPGAPTTDGAASVHKISHIKKQKHFKKDIVSLNASLKSRILLYMNNLILDSVN